MFYFWQSKTATIHKATCPVMFGGLGWVGNVKWHKPAGKDVLQRCQAHHDSKVGGDQTAQRLNDQIARRALESRCAKWASAKKLSIVLRWLSRGRS
ncbi:hypothetical protein GSI_02811 [Ganoderma sinense ZZ0214-1]|uniref:Uncharacterized protein n=1 Tax=Ganoderma sinense ZZ0214-1 TaxID=1077348 RepID=A0A2G8SMM9_9APHY|nr:hypothetical protein GSI_02811 [Ganoderma sinense ZZ0214-1]